MDILFCFRNRVHCNHNLVLVGILSTLIVPSTTQPRTTRDFTQVQETTASSSELFDDLIDSGSGLDDTSPLSTTTTDPCLVQCNCALIEDLFQCVSSGYTHSCIQDVCVTGATTLVSSTLSSTPFPLTTSVVYASALVDKTTMPSLTTSVSGATQVSDFLRQHANTLISSAFGQQFRR
eukprot:m.715036 g.715036  ORF g.715036 m.715036 type:complete len:178 (-) comp22975_c1_seq2:64-597(-)